MKKVIHQRQSDIFEKIVQRNGRLFRVRFIVVESAGKLRGRIVSYEEVLTVSSVKDKGLRIKDFLCLPPSRARHAVKDEGLRIKDSFSSPYFSLEFFTSQMTRAPATKTL